MEMKKYEIYAGIGSTDEDVSLIERIYLDSDNEAIDYAKSCAISLYNLNPKRDIFEIMEDENVGENEAFEIFKNEAVESVVYFVQEYSRDIHGNTIMTRHY